MSYLHLVSIFLELLVVILGLALAISKKKVCGWFLALTFAIYVFYDLARFFALNISHDVLYLIFFTSSVSILIGAWLMYKKS